MKLHCVPSCQRWHGTTAFAVHSRRFCRTVGGHGALLLVQLVLIFVSAAQAEEHLGASVVPRSLRGNDHQFIEAVQLGNIDRVQSLIKAGADVNARSSFGQTGLHIVCLHPLLPEELGLILIKAGADIDMQDPNTGWTALMMAVVYRHNTGNTTLALALIKAGANVRLVNRIQETALHLCAVYGRDNRTASAILGNGIDIDMLDGAGRTPLYRAVQFGKLGMLRWLISNGADPARCSLRGLSPLEVARDPDIIELLERRTPRGWNLVLHVASLPNTWLHVVSGVLAGALLAFVSRTLRSRQRRENDDDTTSLFVPGVEHGILDIAVTALEARTGQTNLKIAMRALEILACVAYPLGVCMLAVTPWWFLPAYFVFYIAPTFLHITLAGVLERPVFLLAGGTPIGAFTGCKDARIPRVFATVSLLVFFPIYTKNCEQYIQFLLHGQMMLQLQGVFATPLTGWGDFSMLNRIGSPIVCPEEALQPLHRVFMVYAVVLWVAACLYVLVVLVDGCGCFGVSSVVGTLEEQTKLARTIGQTQSEAEIGDISGDDIGLPGIRTKAMPWFKWCPPGGQLVTICMVFLDCLVFDTLGVVNQLLAYGHKFATVMVGIMTFSFCIELEQLSYSKLVQDIQKSKHRGFLVGSLYHIVDSERSCESPLSFALTVYMFPFALRGPFSFVSSMLSLLSSLYGIAVYVKVHADTRTSASVPPSLNSRSNSLLPSISSRSNSLL